MELSTIVFAAFRIINLSILLGLFGYLFYKKIVPIIIDAIQRKKDERRAHKTDLVNAEQRVVLLDKRIVDRKALAKSLGVQVKLWHEMVSRHEAQLHAVDATIIEKYDLYETMQREFRKQRSREQIIVPQVCTRVDEALDKQFSNSAARQTYLDQVIREISS